LVFILVDTWPEAPSTPCGQSSVSQTTIETFDDLDLLRLPRSVTVACRKTTAFEMVQVLTTRQGRIWTSQTGWINEDFAIILGGFSERLRMNYSTEETRDDEDRQSKECGPEVTHPGA